MSQIISRCCSEQILYDGSQMKMHWAYEKFGIEGDSIVYFAGPCSIPHDKMIDLEDRNKGSKIEGTMMLHFIIEHFFVGPFEATILQRLFASLARDVIERASNVRLDRDGDDIFVAGPNGGKLTISVASSSVFGSKIHFGINIELPHGIDVPVACLQGLKVDHLELAEVVARRYAGDFDGIVRACRKVRGLF